MSGLTRKFMVVGGNACSQGLKVGFASSDGKYVDQHFGSALAISVYAVDMDHAELIAAAEFQPIGADETEDKLLAKLDLLEGCVAVYCRACGNSAIRQLIEHGVQPVKVQDDLPVKELINAFQVELREGPSTWLARAINRQKDGAFFNNDYSI